MATKRTELDIRVRGADAVTRDLRGMGVEGERAFQRIAKATAPASAGLSKLDKVAGAARGRLTAMAGALGALGPAGLAAAGVAAAGGGLFAVTKSALEAVDALGKQAERTGVSVEALQELQYAAGLYGASQESVNRGLETFARNLGTLQTRGAGPLKRQLAELNPELLRTLETVGSTEQAFDLVVRQIASYESQAQRAALANAAFGGTGAELVNVLKDGTAGLEAARDRAHDLGVVVSTDLALGAAEANDRMAELALVVERNAQRALVGFAPIVADSAAGLTDFAVQAAQAAQGVLEFLGIIEVSTRRRLQFVARARREAESQLRDLEDRPAGDEPGPLGRANLEDLRARVAALRAEEGRLRLDRRREARQRAAELAAERAAVEAQLEKLRGTREAHRAAGAAATAAGKAATGAAREATAADREREQALDRIAKLEQEVAEAGLAGVDLLAARRDAELAEFSERKAAELGLETEFAAARALVVEKYAREANAAARDEAARAAEDAAKAAEDAAREQRDALLAPFRTAAEGAQRAFGETFRALFEDGVDSSAALSAAMLAIFKDLAAELASLLVIRAIVQPVLGGLAGAVGGGGGLLGGLLSAILPTGVSAVAGAAGLGGGVGAGGGLGGGLLGLLGLGGPALGAAGATGAGLAAGAILPTTTAGVSAVIGAGGTVTGLIVPGVGTVTIAGGASPAAAGVTTGAATGISAGVGAAVGGILAGVIAAALNTKAFLEADNGRGLYNTKPSGFFTRLGTPGFISGPLEVLQGGNALRGLAKIFDPVLVAPLLDALGVFGQGPSIRDAVLDAIGETLDQRAKAPAGTFNRYRFGSLGASGRAELAAIQDDEGRRFLSRLVAGRLAGQGGFGGTRGDVRRMVQGGTAALGAAGRDVDEVLERLTRSTLTLRGALRLTNDSVLQRNSTELRAGMSTEIYVERLAAVIEAFGGTLPRGLDAATAAAQVLAERGYATAEALNRVRRAFVREQALAGEDLVLEPEVEARTARRQLRSRGKGKRGRKRAAERRAAVETGVDAALEAIDALERGLAILSDTPARAIAEQYADLAVTFDRLNRVGTEFGEDYDQLPTIVEDATAAVASWGDAILALIDDLRAARLAAEDAAIAHREEVDALTGASDTATVYNDLIRANAARFAAAVASGASAGAQLGLLDRQLALLRAQAAAATQDVQDRLTRQLRIVDAYRTAITGRADAVGERLAEVAPLAALAEPLRDQIRGVLGIGEDEAATLARVATDVSAARRAYARATSATERAAAAARLTALVDEQLAAGATALGTGSNAFATLRAQALGDLERVQADAEDAAREQTTLLEEQRDLLEKLVALDEAAEEARTAAEEETRAIERELAVALTLWQSQITPRLEAAIREREDALRDILPPGTDLEAILADPVAAQTLVASLQLAELEKISAATLALQALAEGRAGDPDADTVPTAALGAVTVGAGTLRVHGGELVARLDNPQLRALLAGGGARITVNAAVTIHAAPGMTAGDAALYGRTAADALEARIVESYERGALGRRMRRRAVGGVRG